MSGSYEPIAAKWVKIIPVYVLQKQGWHNPKTKSRFVSLENTNRL